ncbi:hypothetical protein [Hymenobacter pini]|uniref:hypothetical protein n=1 Tax=Hymenobacter pini TaxID=2880879 RepID=UPI0021D435E8|nr:hypothetical protein [Hymenobacter pini]
MPGLVGQVLLLARCYVNIGALGESVGLKLGRPGGVVMHSHIVQGIAREVFHAGLEHVGEAGAVWRGQAGRRCLLAGAGGNGLLLLALDYGGGALVGLGDGAAGSLLSFHFGLGNGYFHVL